MRIDAYNKINQLYNATNAKKITKTQENNLKDSLEISETGKTYQVAKNAVASAPDIREDLVNDIKRRMESGTYNINCEEVASHIVDRMFNEEA